ncbi:MAG: hypothetical protein ABH877_04510 [bacterium]
MDTNEEATWMQAAWHRAGLPGRLRSDAETGDYDRARKALRLAVLSLTPAQRQCRAGTEINRRTVLRLARVAERAYAPEARGRRVRIDGTIE